MALLIKILHGRKVLTFAVICVGALSVAATLWWNAQLGGIINRVSAGGSLDGMLSGALAAMLLMGAANYLKDYASGYACEYMAHDLRMGYARHFTSLPVIELERLNAGEQLSRLQNELAGVSDYLAGNLFQLFFDGVSFLTTFIWLLCINPALTLAANLPAIAIVAYVIWSSKIIGAATERSQQAKGQLNRHADTLLTLFPVIRLFDATRMILDGYAAAVRAWQAQTVRAERTKARLMSLSGLMGSLPLLLLFGVGGTMAANGALTIGTLYVFLNLSGNITGVLRNMPGHIAAFRQFAANMKRISPHIVLVQKETAA